MAVILGCMSAAILLAEATLLPSGIHLSLFSLLINAVGKQEVLVQVKFRKDYTYICTYCRSQSSLSDMEVFSIL